MDYKERLYRKRRMARGFRALAALAALVLVLGGLGFYLGPVVMLGAVGVAVIVAGVWGIATCDGYSEE